MGPSVPSQPTPIVTGGVDSMLGATAPFLKPSVAGWNEPSRIKERVSANLQKQDSAYVVDRLNEDAKLRADSIRRKKENDDRDEARDRQNRESGPRFVEEFERKKGKNPYTTHLRERFAQGDFSPPEGNRTWQEVWDSFEENDRSSIRKRR